MVVQMAEKSVAQMAAMTVGAKEGTTVAQMVAWMVVMTVVRTIVS